MNSLFHKIIDALRQEMNEYGGLLHLFQQQQESVLRHDPEEFLSLNEGVETQLQRIQQQRNIREALVRDTALAAGVSPDSPLTGLLSYCPAELQPLLTALIQEINDLLQRTQRRSRQNHMLLGQCLELARQMVAITKPEAATRTYNGRGKFYPSSSACHSLNGVVA